MQRFLYKIREVSGGRSKKGVPYVNHCLTVPPDIARSTPEGTQFAFSADEDGFHYTRVAEERPESLPSWAKSSANGETNEEKPTARPRPRPSA